MLQIQNGVTVTLQQQNYIFMIMALHYITNRFGNCVVLQ